MSTVEDTAISPAVRTFMELAAIRSPSYHEADVAAYVRGFLEGLGLEVGEDAAGSEIPAGCGNLYAELPATAPGTPIFLCAHLDTVTLEDDVVPVIEDGRITNANRAILGGDNKGAVAVMLELARELVESGELHAGLELVFTPCEEVGLLGAKHFDVSQLTATFGYVYDHGDDIGKIVVRAPSQVSLRATFVGVPAHSGIAPEQGRSAIAAAATAVSRMQLGRIDAETTANVGLIEGGTAVNIIPERCVIRGEARGLDHDRAVAQAAAMVEIMVDAAAEHNVDVEVDSHDEYRAYQFRENHPAVALAAAALERAGYPPEFVPCGGGADAHIFNANGKPCVNLPNAMRKIHTPDEYMEIADIDGMLRVSRELVAGALAAD